MAPRNLRFLLHLSVRFAQCLDGVASTLILDNTVLGHIRKDQSPVRAPSTPAP
jgi:hypothetical protein